MRSKFVGKTNKQHFFRVEFRAIFNTDRRAPKDYRDFDSYGEAERWCRQIGRKDLIKQISEITN